MATTTFWGSQISTNTTVQGNQVFPHLRALKNGTFLSVWEDRSEAGADNSVAAVYGQFFNADGTKKGGEFQVNTTSLGRQSNAQVVELNDGRLVVAWHDESAGHAIRARYYSADGTPIGSDFLVSSEPLLNSGDFSVTALSNGGYAVAYLSDNGQIRAKSFTEALEAKSEIVVATAPQGSHYNTVDIVAQQGHYTVLFSEENFADGPSGHGRVLSNDGAAGDSIDFLHPKPFTQCYFDKAATLSNGLTAVTWTEYFVNGGSSATLKVKLLNPDGLPHSGEIFVASGETGSLHMSAITHLADGGFAVAYYKDVPGEPPSSDLMDFYLATFDSNGNRVGSDLLVDRMHAGYLVESLATLADGRVVVTWGEDSGVDKEQLYAQIVDPRQKAISVDGTSRDDQYIGTQFNDTLNGGAGADTLTGSAGNDTFYVDNARDQVVERSGQGTDTVIASGSYSLDLSAEVEVLKLGDPSGRSALTLEGSNTANAITGNSGANSLKGYGSNDKLSGGAGNDKLYGGTGNDGLYGGSGRDTFVFDTKADKSTNVDRIYDFKVRDDSIWLDNAVFTRLGRGSVTGVEVKADMFVKGSRAKDAEDRIIYDKKTGALYYDADGTGHVAQVKIATLSKNLKMTYKDFFVI